jgi:hypothetical protein
MVKRLIIPTGIERPKTVNAMDTAICVFPQFVKSFVSKNGKTELENAATLIEIDSCVSQTVLGQPWDTAGTAWDTSDLEWSISDFGT